MKARILVVDDHPLFRQGLVVALQRTDEFEIVGEAGSAAEAIGLARHAMADLAIVDVLMPTTSGLTLTVELFELQPLCRVLALSVIDEPGVIADLLRAHACGFASKTQPIAQVIEAVRQVLGGHQYLPPHVSRAAVDAALATTGAHPLTFLSRREREVFELLIRGLSNDEVASKLFISTRTAETHRQRIMHKLSSHSIIELQRISARHGGLAT